MSQIPSHHRRRIKRSYKIYPGIQGYYRKKVLVLLDEYDTPLQEAYINGYWDDLVAFTRTMFNNAFKTNPSLERSIMTGITWVSKESIRLSSQTMKSG